MWTEGRQGRKGACALKRGKEREKAGLGYVGGMMGLGCTETGGNGVCGQQGRGVDGWTGGQVGEI